jgi:protein-L-isoaspartate(D-aspartate) O-methyltransferase
MPISAHREFFATLVTANVGVKSPSALQRAFASTPREDFLGPGPWRLLTPVGYIETPSDDPAFVYYDAAISVLPLKNINNGQPTLHAMCLSALKIREGETITHIGAGTGYYTALLSQLTGPSGAVHAFELEAELADRAAQCLSNATNVRVHHRSGTEGEPGRSSPTPRLNRMKPNFYRPHCSLAVRERVTKIPKHGWRNFSTAAIRRTFSH